MPSRAPHDPAHPEPVEGRAGAPAALSAIAIPEGLRDVIGRRLSRLSPDCNRLLAIAAVIGRDFGLDTLQTVSELEEEPLLSALEEALHIGVLEEQSRPGSIRYRFAHAFFRQTLYEELIAPRRLRLHQQVAAALETQYKNRLEEHASELAEHFAQSTDRDDLAKAVRYGELAAQRATAVYAYSEAARHLEQALAVQEVLDPDDKAKRCDLLLALGEAILPSEDPTRAIHVAAEEAFGLAEALHDHERAARAAVVALRVIHRVGGSGAHEMTEQAKTWCERADRSAPDGSVVRVYADAYVGIYAIQLVSRDLGHAYIRRAASAARRIDDNSVFYMAAGMALRFLLALRDHDTVFELAEQALRHDRKGARSAELAFCLLSSAEHHLERGDRATARVAWRELRELAVHAHDATVSIWAEQPALCEAFLDGKLEEATVQFETTLDESRAVGVQPGPSSLQLYARALIYQGKATEALLNFFTAPNRPARAARAHLLAQLGRNDEALSTIAEFKGFESDEDESGITVLANLLGTAILVRDLRAAGPLARRLTPLAPLPICPAAGVSYGRLLGGAARLQDDPQKARGYYEQALPACESISFRPESALIHLELAELLLEHYHDERADAIAHLDFAIAEFREMKMQPSLERALRHKEVLKA